MKGLSFKPVDKTNWKDLEKFFESRGGPHYCWCMVWRKMEEGKSRANNADKKSSMKTYIKKKYPVGLLCYDHSEPIAWCSIAPRESYRKLGGDNSLTDVWSLVCFFIKREFRQKGISVELIKQAIKFAKANGAKYVEAYPVDPDSPSYTHLGFKPVFNKMGFKFKYKVGIRRNVMTIKV